MNYPTFTPQELQQALQACQMRIKPDLKALTALQIQHLSSALQSPDDAARGFACLLCLHFSALEQNAQAVGKACLQQLVACAASAIDYVRQYSIFTLARVAEITPALLSGQQLPEKIAGFAGNYLSEATFDAPAFFLAKYYNQDCTDQVSDKTAQQLLIYLCQRLNCQLGEADAGFQLTTILTAMKNITTRAQFAQNALVARLPMTLASYLSGLLNSGETCQPACVQLIFEILRNVFDQLQTPSAQNNIGAEDFDYFLQQETQSFAEMDFYGVIRMYSLPAEGEFQFSHDVFRAVLAFVAAAMRTRAFAEDCYNHFQNKVSKSTVPVASYLTGIMLHAGMDLGCLQSVFEIACYFCYFRYINDKVAASDFLPLTRQFIQAFNAQHCSVQDARGALEAMFQFIAAITTDAFSFIDARKLYFEDFDASQRLALNDPGKTLLELFEGLIDLADATQADQFVYQSNLAAILQISQLHVALMPFLHAATSLELLRGKFKAVRPSRIPPIGVPGARALVHLLGQRRSVKLAAIVPFSLRLFTRVEECAPVILQLHNLEKINALVDWLASSENQFSRIGDSVLMSQKGVANSADPVANELSDETMLQQKLTLQGYAWEAVLEIIQLLSVFAANNLTDYAVLANVLNTWAQMSGVDAAKAQQGAAVVAALGRSLGAAGARKLRSSVTKGVFDLLDSTSGK